MTTPPPPTDPLEQLREETRRLDRIATSALKQRTVITLVLTALPAIVATTYALGDVAVAPTVMRWIMLWALFSLIWTVPLAVWWLVEAARYRGETQGRWLQVHQCERLDHDHGRGAGPP